jgi:hypothetical protein
VHGDATVEGRCSLPHRRVLVYIVVNFILVRIYLNPMQQSCMRLFLRVNDFALLYSTVYQKVAVIHSKGGGHCEHCEQCHSEADNIL